MHNDLSYKKVFKAMEEIDPAAIGGALVSVAKLRAKFAIEKSAFDQAILAMAREAKIALHYHDYPGSISAAERDAMITDGVRYFGGIAIRL